MANGSSLTAEANLRDQGSTNTSLQFTAGSTAAESSVLDAYIRYRHASGKWDVAAFVNNALNSQVVTRGQGTGVANAVIYFASLSPPRTYGLRANYYF